jgi:hypothetical protein
VTGYDWLGVAEEVQEQVAREFGFGASAREVKPRISSSRPLHS